jgi:hypothetical protein
MLDKGYSLPAIKQSLLNYGYPESMIDHAIYNSGSGKKQVLSNKVIIAAVILILIVASVLYFAFNMLNLKKDSVPSMPGITISSMPTEIFPGEFLLATIKMPATNELQVYMKYEVFDSSGERIKWTSEDLTIAEGFEKNIQMEMPSDLKAGDYVFSVKASSGKQNAKAQKSFKVGASISKPNNNQNQNSNTNPNSNPNTNSNNQNSSLKSCPASCDDNDPSTVDYCDQTTFKCIHKQSQTQQSKCGDGICASSESASTCPSDCKSDVSSTEDPVWTQLDNIKELAKTNSQKALTECNTIDQDYKDKCLEYVGESALDPNICEKIEDSLEKDKCFSNIAKGLSNKEICENIEKDDRKDYCYINFMQNGDYSVCDKLTNKYLKKSCTTLKETTQ